MTLICATIAEDTVKKAVKAAKSLKCDVVEVRLDFLKDASELDWLGRINKPVIVTCMPKWEGGRFGGTEGERIGILEKSLKFADFVTIELKTDPGLRDELIITARNRNVKVIIAHHDFENTPSSDEIMEVLEAEEDAGGDIAKVAYMPRSKKDVLSVLVAQVNARLNIPVIALSMGEMGRVTRVAGPMLGGFLMYAAASERKKTAAGQYTIKDMNMLRKIAWI